MTDAFAHDPTLVLPGDLPQADKIARIIRVDHAGEYGAKRIYAGQLAILERRASPAAPAIRHMAEQESRHLETFERLIVERRVRPTALLPLWHLAGYALGAATALLGEKAAMACTIAVEEAIDAHYGAQSAALGADEAALKGAIDSFRADENDHRETAERAGGATIAGYRALSAVIKSGSKLAIFLSERI